MGRSILGPQLHKPFKHDSYSSPGSLIFSLSISKHFSNSLETLACPFSLALLLIYTCFYPEAILVGCRSHFQSNQEWSVCTEAFVTLIFHSHNALEAIFWQGDENTNHPGLWPSCSLIFLSLSKFRQTLTISPKFTNITHSCSTGTLFWTSYQANSTMHYVFHCSV